MGRKRFSRAIEKAVFKKYSQRCAICGTRTEFDYGTLDHKIPLSLGGLDKPENLQWTCHRCNILKGNKMKDEEVRKLLFLPEDYRELIISRKRETKVQQVSLTVSLDSIERLSYEGLDQSEILKDVKTLHENYQSQTIIPELFKTRTHEKLPEDIKLANLAFDYRLPREWFVANQRFNNMSMFLEFGRRIALLEHIYLHRRILECKSISSVKCDFSPEGIVKAIEASGIKPNALLVPVRHYIEMYHWRDKARVEYSTREPKPRIDAFLCVDGYRIKLIPSLGMMPLHTPTLLNSENMLWHVKRYNYGAIFIALGNDRLYPDKYVELIAGTTASWKFDPADVWLLKPE